MKTALITGASSGIGYELAKVFAEKKCDLILIARNAERLEEIARELNQHYLIKVKFIAKDLCSMNALDEIRKEIDDSGIHIDYLVNNAGFGHMGQFVDNEWDKEQRMIQLNITALTYLTKVFAKEMVEKGYGRILNIASTAAFLPGPGMAVYFASKAFVLSFSEAIAAELEGSGVTVTTLCPGPTKTNFQSAANMESSRLFHSVGLAESQEVARFGYEAMMQGRRVAIPGFMNKLTAEASRLAPRRIITKLVKRMNETNL